MHDNGISCSSYDKVTETYNFLVSGSINRLKKCINQASAAGETEYSSDADEEDPRQLKPPGIF
jgi:hypothetical protein